LFQLEVLDDFQIFIYLFGQTQEHDSSK